MRHLLSTLVLILCVMMGQGQEKKDIPANKALLNKIEFFLNTQMTDSIYQMGTENFKQQIGAQGLTSLLQNIYPLGRIKSHSLIETKGTVSKYLLEYSDEKLFMFLGVDSLMQYDVFGFYPYTNDAIAAIPEKTEAVARNVEVVSATDFLIDSLAQTYIKKGNTRSLAIGVIHRNQLRTYFYGETQQGISSLPTADTRYEIGSLTKLFTATLLADLVNKQLISLDDSIVKFLPDSLQQNPSLQKITFRSLANHSSGLPRMASNWNTAANFDAKDPYASYNRQALFSYLKNCSLTRAPAEEYEYSNLGYGLLGELITIITKKSYMQLVDEIICKPLAMTHTSDKKISKEEQLIKVYDSQGAETTQWSFQALTGAGALKSTVNDLLKFASCQFNMPQSDIEKNLALTREFTFFIPPATDIGLGWHMDMLDGLIYYNHNGGTAGSSSFIGLSPDSKSAVVVLSNASESVTEVAKEMLTKLLTAKN